MAVCVHCGASKGKRACPALGGEICAPCCGKHRLVAIACPADCRWLGGLAAMRDAATIGYTDAEHDAAYLRLIEFTETARELVPSRTAFIAMLGLPADRVHDERLSLTEELGDHVAAAVTVHIAFGHRAADGTRAVDRLLSAHGRDLAPAQVAALVALQRARGGLFLVEAAQAGVGVVLRDHLRGDRVTIATDHPLEGIEAGVTVFGWLIENAGTPEIAGPMVNVPPALVAAVAADLAAAVAAVIAADAQAVLTASAPHVLAALREADARAAAAVAATDPAPP